MNLEVEDVSSISEIGRRSGSQRIILSPAIQGAPPLPLFQKNDLPQSILESHAFYDMPFAVSAYFLADHRLGGQSFLKNAEDKIFYSRECFPTYMSPSVLDALPGHYHDHYYGKLRGGHANKISLDKICAVPLHHHLVYGHFLLEMLPRFFVLEMLRSMGIEFYIAIPESIPQYVRNYISYLFDPKDIVYFNPSNDVVEAKHFIVPSMMNNDYHYHPLAGFAFDWCKRKVLQGVPQIDNELKRKYDKIYLSRSKLTERSWHFLENEADVEHALAANGYHICYPEQMSLPDQLQMFDSSNLIVSEYSSASHGVVFAQNSRKNLTINYINALQSRVSRLKRQHLAVLSPSDGRFRQNVNSLEDGSFTVDPVRLLAMCEDFDRWRTESDIRPD